VIKLDWCDQDRKQRERQLVQSNEKEYHIECCTFAPQCDKSTQKSRSV